MTPSPGTIRRNPAARSRLRPMTSSSGSGIRIVLIPCLTSLRPYLSTHYSQKNRKEETVTQTLSIGGLKIAKSLHDFIVEEALPGTDIAPPSFWSNFEALATALVPVNRALVAKR